MKQKIINDGNAIPLLGLGTWKLSGEACVSVVQTALKLGYIHIDTAHEYWNHKEIGKAIANFEREKLFLTSKLWIRKSSNFSLVRPRIGLESALKELGTDYLDLYIIHWPDRSQPMHEILNEMKELKDEGKIKSFGVSNFTINHLKDLIEKGIKLAVNQVEFHPYFYQKELLDYCNKNNICLTAHTPLARGAILDDQILIEIGKMYNKTPATIALHWMIQKGIVAIPKSSSENHLKENLAIFDFSLSNEEMKQIDSLNKNHRVCDLPEISDFDY